MSASWEAVWGKGGYRMYEERIRELEALVLGTPCPKCDCEDCKKAIAHYRELEAEVERLTGFLGSAGSYLPEDPETAMDEIEKALGYRPDKGGGRPAARKEG